MTDTPKKRGRPVGKKPVNKTRKAMVIEIRQSQLELAEKLGIPKEKYVDALAKLNMVRTKKVNWQTLAKQLQAALESQIDDYTILETKVQVLEKEANEFAESHRRYITIISYLETKLGLNPI
jgi:DNA-binding Xre family transcriptional regulator